MLVIGKLTNIKILPPTFSSLGLQIRIFQAMGDEFFLPDDSHYWMSQMKGPMYLRLLPNAEHTTALSGLSTKHWVWTLRHTFLATMLDRKMPDYCVERYLKEDGTRGVKVIFL